MDLDIESYEVGECCGVTVVYNFPFDADIEDESKEVRSKTLVDIENAIRGNMNKKITVLNLHEEQNVVQGIARKMGFREVLTFPSASKANSRVTMFIRGGTPV